MKILTTTLLVMATLVLTGCNFEKFVTEAEVTIPEGYETIEAHPIYVDFDGYDGHYLVGLFSVNGYTLFAYADARLSFPVLSATVFCNAAKEQDKSVQLIGKYNERGDHFILWGIKYGERIVVFDGKCDS